MPLLYIMIKIYRAVYRHNYNGADASQLHFSRWVCFDCTDKIREEIASQAQPDSEDPATPIAIIIGWDQMELEDDPI